MALVASYEELAGRLYPVRWWLLAAFFVLPFAFPLVVRYGLTMPGFISGEADWFLLKLTLFFAAWPWALFLVAVCFHPHRGLLRPRSGSPSCTLSAFRALLALSIIALLLSPFAFVALAP